MVISIKRILLVLFSTLVGVFAAINFKCALEMRIILAVAFSIVNIFSSLYTLSHWRELRKDRYSQSQYFLMFIVMEAALWVFTALVPSGLTGIVSWLWLAAINLCFFGILVIIAIFYERLWRKR
ncbi:hypothetical protein EFR94_07895 [Levilactobacillus brevis]|nr:hypothetical protein [Levilactobacillus brevis]